MSGDSDIRDRALAAMNDFIGRVVRAERMSGVKGNGHLKLVRDEYVDVSAPKGLSYRGRDKGHEEAHEILTRFVRVAQGYYERARSNITFARQWTRYEDQKLRKPMARLVRLQSESHKRLALRRLQGPSSFLSDGGTVGLQRLLKGWGHKPRVHAPT